MIIVCIKSKLVKIVFVVILANFFWWGVLFVLGKFFEWRRSSYSQETEIIHRYSLSIPGANVDETCLSAFLTVKNLNMANASVHSCKEIEIFDIGKGEVVKKVQLNPGIQEMAGGLLKAIIGVYAKVKAIPEKGQIAYIPLDPAIRVENKWLNASVNELFVIFPEEGKPYLLILDEKGNPFFYTFKGNADALLKM